MTKKDSGATDDDNGEDQKTPEELAAETKAQEEADKIARGDDTDAGDKTKTGDDGVSGEGAAATDDADAKAKAEADAEEAAKATAKSTMVPKGRLDTKNRMLDDANKTITALEAKLAESGVAATAGKDTDSIKADSIEAKIIVAEDAFVAARKDGDADAELKAMRAIRSLERDQRKEDESNIHSGAVREATESVKFDDVLSVIEKEHPELNPDNYDPDDPKSVYSQDMVDEVSDLMDGFVLKGHTKSEAIIRAVGYVVPAKGDGSDEVSEARSKKKEEREAAARAKALKASGTTAPDTKDVGKSGDAAGKADDAPDANKLSEEEFDALPETMKQRMRGDEVG